VSLERDVERIVVGAAAATVTPELARDVTGQADV
jgi:hypothetical protein